MTRGSAANKRVPRQSTTQERRAALVLVAVEKRGRASGRARMSVIPDFKAGTITRFLNQTSHLVPRFTRTDSKASRVSRRSPSNTSLATSRSVRSCAKA